jgi:peroxiredoxin Q/BCP
MRPVFHPDDTPGCTKEACDFRDNLPKFKTGKAIVLSVSVLDEASKAQFAEKYDEFPLLMTKTTTSPKNTAPGETLAVRTKVPGRSAHHVSHRSGQEGSLRRWDK